jgi:hypothetical protein
MRSRTPLIADFINGIGQTRQINNVRGMSALKLTPEMLAGQQTTSPFSSL